MKLVKVGLVLAGLLLARTSAFAQDDKEQLKKKILDEVEKRLKAEEERILKDIAKVIDEELAKAKKGEKPSGTEKKEPKKEEPKKEEPKKEEPKKEEPKARGFLGVNLEDLGDDEKKELGIEKGVRLLDIVPDSPAAKSGLQKDDILLSFDGAAVDSVQDLRDLIAGKGAGALIKVKILRDKKQKTVAVKLARHPDDPEPKAEEPKKENPKKEDPKKENPKKEEPKKEEPKKDDDLRNRIKKFLEKEDGGKKDNPKKDDNKQSTKPDKKEEKKTEKSADPSDDILAFDDTTFDQIRTLLEQFGMDPESYFEKGKDGKWRPNSELRDMLKQFDFKKFLNPNSPDNETPKAETPKKEEKKEEKKTGKKEESTAAKKAWIGVVPEELSDDTRAQFDIEEGVGFSVVEVLSDSPAEKLLKKDDIVVAIDGKKIKGEEGLAKFIQKAKPGQAVELTILRKGKEQKVKVTLGERKE